MTTWFVTRHEGAKVWAKQQGLIIDHSITHLNMNDIQSGDIIIGTLPINIIYAVNQKRGRYFHLSLELPPESRGKELSAEDMDEYGASLQEYQAEKIESTLNEEN